MAKHVLEKLQQRLGAGLLETHSDHGNETAVLDASVLLQAAVFLRDTAGLEFDLPVDCTVVDWYQRKEVRFEVIWHLYSLKHKHRVRIKVRVSEEHPECASLTGVWPGMDWHEREAWDMYGVRFVGHPNLKRVLMYEEFVGHPLRKDYPIDKRQPLIEMLPSRSIPTQRQPPREMLNKP
jgi:NADH-quinone oxidoreductase subunit C